MPQLTMEDQPEFAVLPTDSILLLKIKETEVRHVEGRNGRQGWDKLSFTFKLMDILVVGDGSSRDAFEDLIGRDVFGSVPFKLTTSPENRLRQWVEAIYGMELGLGFQLDTDLLVGKTVRGVTSQYKTGKGYLRHQVQDLLPPGKDGAAPAGQLTAQPDPWAVDNGSQPAPVGGGGYGTYSDEPPF